MTRILAIDTMSTYATYDGKVANTYTTNKNCKEYSFYSKIMDVLNIGKRAPHYDVVIAEETRFQYVNSQRIMYGQLAILKVLLHPFKTKLITITPKEVKKYFTGNGNASKEDMIAECKKRGITVKNDHEADAVGIYHSYKEKYE